MAAVDVTKEHIQAGDIFQLVLSQRFERHTQADPFEIYRRRSRPLLCLSACSVRAHHPAQDGKAPYAHSDPSMDGHWLQHPHGRRPGVRPCLVLFAL
jgi:hypothetical protein